MKTPRKTIYSLEKCRVCNVESGRMQRRKILVGSFAGWEDQSKC